MEIVKRDIDTDIHQAIEIAHPRAKESVRVAKEAIQNAFEQTAFVAAIIEKAKQIHKQDLFGFMSEHMTANETKDYLAFYDEYSKRGASLTKRQLIKSGVWTAQQELELRDVTPEVKQGPSIISSAVTFSRHLNKVTERRPPEEMTEYEREQIKEVLRPIVKGIISYFDAL